jgi:hypothetical protein
MFNGIIFKRAYSKPFGLFIDLNNSVYVTEQEKNRIQRIEPIKMQQSLLSLFKK